jgi:cobalamin biosynthesis Mg chelatase CobN
MWPVPETVAMVLWGTDNLKTEGGTIAQALALMGAAPRFDSYGRSVRCRADFRWKSLAARASM